MTAFITLTTAGSDTGPFDLYSDLDGYVSAFETGVSRGDLLAGYSSSIVPDGTTIVRIQSISTLCTNHVDITLTTTTTTTTVLNCTCTLYTGTADSLSGATVRYVICGSSNRSVTTVYEPGQAISQCCRTGTFQVIDGAVEDGPTSSCGTWC